MLTYLFNCTIEYTNASVDVYNVQSIPYGPFITEINSLSPDREEDENSLFVNTTCSNIQVRRIKEVITKAEMS